jgi:hypothetical protein
LVPIMTEFRFNMLNLSFLQDYPYHLSR